MNIKFQEKDQLRTQLEQVRKLPEEAEIAAGSYHPGQAEIRTRSDPEVAAGS